MLRDEERGEWPGGGLQGRTQVAPCQAEPAGENGPRNQVIPCPDILNDKPGVESSVTACGIWYKLNHHRRGRVTVTVSLDGLTLRPKAP